MKNLFIIFFLFCSFNSVSAVEFKGSFSQGSFILGKTEPGSKVIVDEKKIRVTKDGFFAFGLDRDRENDVIIKVVKNDKLNIFKKKVLKRKYKIQRIDGLPPKQVTPPPEVFERIKKDNILIGKARSIDSSQFFKEIYLSN